MAPTTFLGIDGGGSTTTARLEDEHGEVLFERACAATNPRTTELGLVRDRFDELLGEVPAPAAVAVCLAGMRGHDTRTHVGEYFAHRFPSAAVRLEPDYAAAFHTFDEEPTVCVIAGTGSLVCSRDRDGRIVTSGGQGYLLGDEGSAFRLGQLAVQRCVADPDSVSGMYPEICRALGVSSAQEIVATVYGSREPATLLARVAPVVSCAARAGHDWAHTIIAGEMATLADTVVGQLSDHPGANVIIAGLVGGVWSSTPARDAFARALRDRLPHTDVTIIRSPRPPVCGAVRLAREAGS